MLSNLELELGKMLINNGALSHSLTLSILGRVAVHMPLFKQIYRLYHLALTKALLTKWTHFSK